MIQNLLSNSLKYRSERTPEITIKAELVNGTHVMTFTDNGIGIDLSRNKANLFKMFKRFHNHVEGTGLGLYMVHTIVQNQEGTIHVDSEVDKGTTFTISIPEKVNVSLEAVPSN